MQRKLNVKLKFSQVQAEALRAAYYDPHKPAYITQRYLAKLHNVNETTIFRLLKGITHQGL